MKAFEATAFTDENNVENFSPISSICDVLDETIELKSCDMSHASKGVIRFEEYTRQGHYRIFFFLLFFVSSSQRVVEAAYATKRYTPAKTRSSGRSQYDRSITTFSDDGRLLQVEYGMEASTRGGTVACIVVELDSCEDDSCPSSVICVAIANYNLINEADDKVEGKIEAIKSKDDMINFEPSHNKMMPEMEKVHRIDHNCMLITTGLGGDGRALAQSARVASQRLQLLNGEMPTVSELAKVAVAQVQHELTRVSGARPFGVTATVLGVDLVNRLKDNQSHAHLKARLFQSECGGTLNEYDFCSSGRGRKTCLSTLEELHSKLRRSTDDASLKLRLAIEGVARSVFVGDNDAKQVDLWVLHPISGRRGQCRIRCAKEVRELDLQQVASYFTE